jgi:hypothetical protein
LELYEVSPVLHGANNLTSTISIKDDIDGNVNIKDNNFTSMWGTGTTWTGTTSVPTSWDFQMNEKMFGEVVPPELDRQPLPSPEQMLEIKLRKAFASAFGPLSGLKLMGEGQAIFEREGSTWAVRYKIDGSRLTVTRPRRVKVSVRTVIESIKDPGEEPAAHYEDDSPMRLKREVSSQEREKLAERGAALPDGSYPIKTVEDLKNAISAIGRAKDPGAARAHIKKRAKALGATNLIPDSWGDKGGEPEGIENKAGRVISQGNMAKLGKAAEMINEVISAGTRPEAVVDSRPPLMHKKDGQSLLDAYKTAETDSDILVVKGERLSGKVVRLTSRDEHPDMEKVVRLVDELVPLAEKFGWTLLAPSQKSLDEGTCSLGIHLASDDDMSDQVKSLADVLKASDCNIAVEVEKENLYEGGTKSFGEVFLAE